MKDLQELEEEFKKRKSQCVKNGGGKEHVCLGSKMGQETAPGHATSHPSS